MKPRNVHKVLFPLGVLGALLIMTSCSPVVDQVFNPEFLVDTGLKTGGSEYQITPDLSRFVWLKVTNQTEYFANIPIVIRRSLDEEFAGMTIEGRTTLGMLIENCDSGVNPVLSIRVPLAGEFDDAGDELFPIPVAAAYVVVEGQPILIPASELPGVLTVGTHFNCGDTVELIIHPSFKDATRFRISAAIYNAN